MRGTANNNDSFAAIDGDLDGNLGTNLNVPVSASTTNTNDYLYYYLPNRLGSVMGLLDATDDRYMLEYYRYTVYGEATVLPLYDTGLNQIEDTPTDLSDNNTAMLATRTGGGGDATAGRASTFNNQYTFTGRYLDTETGLHYYRFRYYESRTGRFVSRDPAESPWWNLMNYAGNAPLRNVDPTGLDWHDLSRTDSWYEQVDSSKFWMLVWKEASQKGQTERKQHAAVGYERASKRESDAIEKAYAEKSEEEYAARGGYLFEKFERERQADERDRREAEREAQKTEEHARQEAEKKSEKEFKEWLEKRNRSQSSPPSSPRRPSPQSYGGRCIKLNWDCMTAAGVQYDWAVTSAISASTALECKLCRVGINSPRTVSTHALKAACASCVAGMLATPIAANAGYVRCCEMWGP